MRRCFRRHLTPRRLANFPYRIDSHGLFQYIVDLWRAGWLLFVVHGDIHNISLKDNGRLSSLVKFHASRRVQQRVHHADLLRILPPQRQILLQLLRRHRLRIRTRLPARPGRRRHRRRPCRGHTSAALLFLGCLGLLPFPLLLSLALLTFQPGTPNSSLKVGSHYHVDFAPVVEEEVCLMIGLDQKNRPSRLISFQPLLDKLGSLRFSLQLLPWSQNILNKIPKPSLNLLDSIDASSEFLHEFSPPQYIFKPFLNLRCCLVPLNFCGFSNEQLSKSLGRQHKSLLAGHLDSILV